MGQFRSNLAGLTCVAVLLAGAGASAAEPANFHHVHLNVTDAHKTVAFYKRFFGATELLYRDRSRALFTERSFLLMDVVAQPPPTNEGSSLWHIGWSGVDGGSEFRWRAAEGIAVQTPVTRPILPGSDNKAEVMYFWGPDRELIEVSTVNRNHRFEHVHLLVSDIEAATAWFKTHLGLEALHARAIDFHGVLLNIVRVDNVDIVLFARPTPDRDNQFAAEELWPADGFKPTEGRAVDHLAFSYRALEPVLARMTAAGLSVVRSLSTDRRHGHRSFFVRGPDGLLVEIVEDKPIPQGNWQD